MSVAIIDYGVGNLRSIENALDFVGVPHRRVSTPAEVRSEGRLILPGVGAYDRAMENLTQAGLVAAIRDAASAGAAILGICLGMQLLAEYGEEGAGHEGLGLLKGRVRRLVPSGGLRVPHMGFNEVRLAAPHPLVEGIDEGSHFYFAHSFHFEADAADVIARADYGATFTAIVAHGNLMGAQFHPEKSQSPGLRLLRNFCRVGPC